MPTSKYELYLIAQNFAICQLLTTPLGRTKFQILTIDNIDK